MCALRFSRPSRVCQHLGWDAGGYKDERKLTVFGRKAANGDSGKLSFCVVQLQVIQRSNL